MSKLAVGIGVVALTLGVYLLLTMEAPTRAERENPYGGAMISDARRYGGWGCAIGGGLILAVGLWRALRANRHDPDLPEKYRV